jgi:anti-sigma B factor antagonist
MTIKNREVRVYQLPQHVTGNIEQNFLRELREYTERERCRFVLDCSMVKEMTPKMVNLLLSSLEEVMKCNGDVRLAMLSPAAKTVVELAGLNRLFEIYDTTEEAVQSFHQRPISLAPLGIETEVIDAMSGHAA